MNRRSTSARVAPPALALPTSGDDLPGSTLLEILIAIGIIAVALTVFVSALQLGVRSIAGVHEQTIATAIARSQMEVVKTAAWPGPYPTIAAPAGYTVAVSSDAGPLPAIQMITVRVQHDGRDILAVQGYKGQR